MSDIAVRQASIEEIHTVHALIPEFSETQSADFPKRYEGREHVLLIAEVDGRPAGYLIGYDRDQNQSFYCWMAGVVPEYRRKGVLTALMDALESWATEHEYRAIMIKTRNSRREMLSYLVRKDFDIVAFEPKDDFRENRILFRKEIR